MLMDQGNSRKQIECFFADVSEHDMDMLFLEELVASKDFLNIFTQKVGINDAKVLSVYSSKTDITLGESDMTVIVSSNDKKIGLLIEDKIDAIAMPEQATRYFKRGDKGIKQGDYDEYKVFIVAPQKYLSQNKEAEKYPNKVNYETILMYFEEKDDNRSKFKAQQIRQAIEKQKTGYQVIEDERVTEFWNRYSEFQKKYYPGLYFKYDGGAKGTNSQWPRFTTTNKKLYIYHKTSAGYADLTFDRCGNKIVVIDNLLADAAGDYLEKGYSVQIIGKAAAIRILTPVIDVHKPFDDQLEEIKRCFDAIQKLTDLVKRFNNNDIQYLFSL